MKIQGKVSATYGSTGKQLAKQLAVFASSNEKKVLPPLGEVVLAKVMFIINRPSGLGGLKIRFIKLFVKRIKSAANSQGWQWSGARSDSFLTGDVLSWRSVK